MNHWIFEEPVYQSHVIVIHSTFEDLLPTFQSVHPEQLLWPEEDKVDPESQAAYAWTFELGGPWACVWIDLVENPHHYAGHEFVHVGEAVLKSVGVKPKGEALAYYVGWLTREFYERTKLRELPPTPLLEPPKEPLPHLLVK